MILTHVWNTDVTVNFGWNEEVSMTYAAVCGSPRTNSPTLLWFIYILQNTKAALTNIGSEACLKPWWALKTTLWSEICSFNLTPTMTALYGSKILSED